MVASTVDILPVYLDCTELDALSGGVASLEDDSIQHEADNNAISSVERNERAVQSWQLSWTDAMKADAAFIWKLFRHARRSKGFLFIPPLDEDRVFTDQPLGTGNGVATTFQLQITDTLDYDVGAGESTVTYDVNYPLEGTVIVYVDDVSVSISSIALLTGVVTLSAAPANGTAVTASFERAVPVIATSMSVARTMMEGQRSEVRSMQLKELI